MSDDLSPGIPLHIRRVVTGHDASGISMVRMDGIPAVCSDYHHIPGMATRLVWATGNTGEIPREPTDHTTPDLSHVPGPGESRLIIVTFPPDSVFGMPGFDGAAAGAENARLSPGLAELFEPDGFHATQSVDYGIVLDGEITLELSDGSKTSLRRHDVIVQNGTRHAWRNDTDRPATLAFVLMGAHPAT